VDNARLFERGRRRVLGIAATLEIQQSFLRRVDLDAALRLVVMKARQVMLADVAMVVLERDHDGALEVRALDGQPGELGGTTLPREGALADVVDRATTVRLADGVRIPGLDSVTNALVVACTGPGGAGGALLVATMASQRGRWLGEDDVQALQGFAAQTAIALDRAQAQEDREALAALADRDRVARDLHDVVIQRLFATGLKLQGAMRDVEPEVADRLQSAVSDLDGTIRDIRGAIFELSLSDQDTALRQQLHELIAAARNTLGLSPELTLEGPLDGAVPDSVRPNLLAVLMDSLTNVARHAGASRVEVRVAVRTEPDGGTVVAEIRDDGKGFSAPDHENGLRTMRERAAEHGGSCLIESAPGEGTLVRWEVPLRSQG
jgi:signal transduction histidine kinase